MASRKRQTSRLLELLDIAERVHAASEREPEQREQSLAWLRECRTLAKSPMSGAAALRLLEADFMVEWNDGVGPEVEEFWRQVAEAALPVTRQRDVVVETLARGRVASMDDYVALEENFERLQICGKIDVEQAKALNRLLDAFAENPANRRYFDTHDDDDPDDDQPSDDGAEVGQLVRVSDTEYRYDYFGRELTAALQQRGYQGGGETWAAITRALLELDSPELLTQIRFDPEADCLAVWAAEPEPLRSISKLIARALREPSQIARAIAHAEAHLGIE